MTVGGPVAYPDADLAEVERNVGARWELLRGARLLLTGASGFVGGWMLDSLARARIGRALDTRAIVLTRSRERLVAARPWVDEVDWIEVVTGDVRELAVNGTLTHVIHCASAASTEENRDDPAAVCDLIVRGTSRVMEAARHAGALRMLHLSSGAVHRAVGAPVATIAPADLFVHAKRLAEAIVLRGGSTDRLAVVAARCFALLGPGLPLDGAFAAGNFVRDMLAGGPVMVDGDGRAIRTYLHAVDLATWCWVLLLDAPGGSAWDVGGTEETSIGSLAERIAAHRAGVRVQVTGAVGHAPPDRYVPDVRPAAQALGLTPRIGLDEALGRMIAWYSE